jgi:hypothetical protein
LLTKSTPGKEAPDKEAPDKEAPDKEAPDKEARLLLLPSTSEHALPEHAPLRYRRACRHGV